MLVFSLNIRGVVGASKMLALKELLSTTKLDVIQETMMDHVRAKDFFLKVCPTWNCVVKNSIGLSRGLQFGKMESDRKAKK